MFVIIFSDSDDNKSMNEDDDDNQYPKSKQGEEAQNELFSIVNEFNGEGFASRAQNSVVRVENPASRPSEQHQASRGISPTGQVNSGSSNSNGRGRGGPRRGGGPGSRGGKGARARKQNQVQALEEDKKRMEEENRRLREMLANSSKFLIMYDYISNNMFKFF